MHICMYTQWYTRIHTIIYIRIYSTLEYTIIQDTALAMNEGYVPLLLRMAYLSTDRSTTGHLPSDLAASTAFWPWTRAGHGSGSDTAPIVCGSRSSVCWVSPLLDDVTPPLVLSLVPLPFRTSGMGFCKFWPSIFAPGLLGVLLSVGDRDTKTPLYEQHVRRNSKIQPYYFSDETTSGIYIYHYTRSQEFATLYAYNIKTRTTLQLRPLWFVHMWSQSRGSTILMYSDMYTSREQCRQSLL